MAVRKMKKSLWGKQNKILINLFLKINRQIDDMMYGRRSEMKKREA